MLRFSGQRRSPISVGLYGLGSRDCGSRAAKHTKKRIKQTGPPFGGNSFSKSFQVGFSSKISRSGRVPKNSPRGIRGRAVTAGKQRPDSLSSHRNVSLTFFWVLGRKLRKALAQDCASHTG